ncbi:MAG: OmpA family protein, partial [Deltaproteobacteria bacterium]|nr:OmpA family protein [Deltaproteobacteria bacterium]
EKYNDALSMERANAVKAYLMQNFKISLERITVKAYGESMPIASNDTEEGRALNRRVEIDIHD